VAENERYVELELRSDAVFVNGRRITYADWRAEMERLPLLSPMPSLQGQVAWQRLVQRATDAR